MIESTSEATIILGAGASRVLGYPLQNELVEWFRTRLLVQSYRDKVLLSALEKKWGSSIEEALTILENASASQDPFLADRDIPEKQIREVKRLVSRTFWPPPEEEIGIATFKRFLTLVMGRFNRTGLVSLNWDIGLEQCLEELGVAYNYGFMFDGEERLQHTLAEMGLVSTKAGYGGVTVLKPHGSINWLYCRFCRSLTNTWVMQQMEAGTRKCEPELIKGFNPLSVKSIMSNTKRGMPGIPGTGMTTLGTLCLECGEAEDTEPFIVPPTHNKTVEIGLGSPLPRKMFHQLRKTGTVIIVGYSFREADYDVRYLLASALKARSGRPSRSPWYSPHLPCRDLHVILMCGKEATQRIRTFIEHFSAGSRAKVFFTELGYFSGASLGELEKVLKT